MVPRLQQELLTLPEHLRSLPVLVGFVLLDLQFYVYVLQTSVCPFVLFLLAIVLSVLLQYMDSNYPFGIFKLFLPFRSTSVHPVLVGFVLLELQCYVYALQNVVCPFVLFLLTIVLSALLRFTDSDYPFGIFKLFLQYTGNQSTVFFSYQRNESQTLPLILQSLRFYFLRVLRSLITMEN